MSRSSGRADVVALVIAAVAALAMLVPVLRLRASADYATAASLAAPVDVTEGDAAADGLRDLEAARAGVATARAAVRVAADRRFGPAPRHTRAAARVTGLDGSVAGGELTARWLPPAGATGVRLRVEGLGGREAVTEHIVPADTSALRLPVPAAAGTAIIRALPLGTAGPVAEERVAIPYRVPVHVVQVVSAAPQTGEAVLRLERAFDGRRITADIRVLEDDPVTGQAPAGPDAVAVAFDTLLVLERIRTREVPLAGGRVRVPRFLPDGRVARTATGAPLTEERVRPASTRTVVEVVLRAPGDQRQILPLDAAGNGR